MTRRVVRVPRPPARGVIPSVEMRRKRGPKPPDAVIDALVAALTADTTARQDATDAEPVPTPGARWRTAIARAPRDIVRAARRGIRSALGDGAADAPTDDPEGAPNLAGVRTLAGAAQRIAEWAMAAHTAVISALARAAGANWYVWTPQSDDRVRPLHVKLGGSVQRWDRPPLAGLPNFHGHPGEAAGPCRCQAYPIRGATPRKKVVARPRRA